MKRVDETYIKDELVIILMHIPTWMMCEPKSTLEEVSSKHER